MADGVAIFFAMSTQWRWVGAGMAGAMRTGLDYGALPGVAAMLDVKTGPRQLADLRSMEDAAVETWSRRR